MTLRTVLRAHMLLVGIGAMLWVPPVLSAELSLKAGTGGDAVVEDQPLLDGAGQWVVPSPATLIITCKAGVDCSQLKVKTQAVEFQPISVAPGKSSFGPITISDGGTPLELLYKGKSVEKYELMGAARATGIRAAVGGGADAPLPANVILKDVLACDPRGVVSSFEPYDKVNDRAEFVTNVRGTLLAYPNSSISESIDEDDTVVVTVLTHPSLAPYLDVRRSSPVRALGVLNIAGADIELERQSDERTTLPRCIPFSAEVRDFRSGTGTVKISAASGTEEIELGTFDFPVSPLHHGILSFGALSSKVVQDSFKLVPDGAESVIAPGETGKREAVYAFWYTHFVWGARDLEKTPKQFHHRINPSIGIVTDNLDDHALAGVSIDLGAFVFTVGRHFAKTTVLNPASGLNVGDAFDGEESEIPTAKKWKSSTYYGVSVDLRAASALIKSAISGGN